MSETTPPIPDDSGEIASPRTEVLHSHFEQVAPIPNATDLEAKIRGFTSAAVCFGTDGALLEFSAHSKFFDAGSEDVATDAVDSVLGQLLLPALRTVEADMRTRGHQGKAAIELTLRPDTVESVELTASTSNRLPHTDKFTQYLASIGPSTLVYDNDFTIPAGLNRGARILALQAFAEEHELVPQSTPSGTFALVTPEDVHFSPDNLPEHQGKPRIFIQAIPVHPDDLQAPLVT